MQKMNWGHWIDPFEICCSDLTRIRSLPKIVPTGRYFTELVRKKEGTGEVTRQQRSKTTRAKILQAAAKCFATIGYDATGVAKICQDAGVSKGAFYYHFPSKEAVFLALRDQWFTSLDTKLAEIRAQSTTAREQLQIMAKAANQILKIPDEQLPIFLEFWRQATRDQQFRRSIRAPYDRYKEYFRGIIERGIAEGSLQSVDPDIAAHVIVSLAFGLFLQSIVDPEGADWSRLAEKGIQLILQNIAVK